jgi:hypothetical protein
MDNFKLIDVSKDITNAAQPGGEHTSADEIISLNFKLITSSMN